MRVPEHSPFRDPLVRIGYWSGPLSAGDWPDPREFVDPDWDEEDRLDLALYLENGLVARAFMGYSECRLCGAQNRNLELTDGSYVWPDGLSHYVRLHSVRLPSTFTHHVERMEALTDGLTIDDTWWRTAKPETH